MARSSIDGWSASADLLLARAVIGDVLTVAITIASQAHLFRFEIGNPILIAGAAVIGLVAYPLIQPNWGLLK